MFATVKQIFNSKNRDIQKKILFTFAVLFIFKIGTTITVPGVTLDTNKLGFLEIVNAMSGGAFEKAPPHPLKTFKKDFLKVLRFLRRRVP